MTLCERCGNYPNICGCAEVDALAARLAEAIECCTIKDIRNLAMSDIVERLRDVPDSKLSAYAADEIDRLEARLAEAELSRDSWKREAEMNAEFGDQLHAALETLKAHSIHLTEKWCWCGPTVESHADSASGGKK